MGRGYETKPGGDGRGYVEYLGRGQVGGRDAVTLVVDDVPDVLGKDLEPEIRTGPGMMPCEKMGYDDEYNG